MTPDSASLEQLLRRSPTVADAGFSQAVLARIASRERRRRQMLASAWLVSAVVALTGMVTCLPSWLAVLQSLSAGWSAATEQALQQGSGAPLQALWQSSAALVVAGLLAVMLAAASAAAWDWIETTGL